MDRRRLGTLLTVLGLLLVVVAVVGLLTSSSTSSLASTATTVTTTTQTTTGPPATTSAVSTSTTTATTAAPPPASTAPTTTVVAAATPADVADFITEYSRWLASGDFDSVWSTLHPAVIDAFGEQLCRSWVEREVMALSGYGLDGDVPPARRQTLSLPNGPVTFERWYSVPVVFIYQGETFHSEAGLVDDAGTVWWLGTCR